MYTDDGAAPGENERWAVARIQKTKHDTSLQIDRDRGRTCNLLMSRYRSQTRCHFATRPHQMINEMNKHSDKYLPPRRRILWEHCLRLLGWTPEVFRRPSRQTSLSGQLHICAYMHLIYTPFPSRHSNAPGTLSVTRRTAR